MSDEFHGLPEIISAFKDKGHYFCVVCCRPDGKQRYFRFGVSGAGYKTLENMFQLRPFDRMPGLKYRYFATGGCGAADKPEIGVRIEQDRQAKNFSLSAPKNLAANLKWLVQLKEWDRAAYLAITPDAAKNQKIGWQELLKHLLTKIFHSPKI